MIKVKFFDDYGIEVDLQKFLNENKITREQIISIDFAIDSDAHKRLRARSSKQVLLVWEDTVVEKGE